MIAKLDRSSAVFVVLALAGCASDEDGAVPPVQPLDPAGTHYGKTYGEWGAQWWAWIYSVHGCEGPLEDPTGARCLDNQDPNSPVVFLPGAPSGIVVRELCPIPADKALLFPIVNVKSDSVGEEESWTVEKSCAAVEAAREVIQPRELFVYVDGVKLQDLDRYWVGPTPFSYKVPPPPNNYYSCQGIAGVEGTISDACSGGYYILLPPLGPGRHELRFGGRVEIVGFELDVTYRWTAQ